MLFYLPRLFVYHVEHAQNEKFKEVAVIQELKLYKYIGLPAFWEIGRASCRERVLRLV